MHLRFRSGLTAAQAAFSVVLLVGAGLFVRSLGRVNSLDLGIEPGRVQVAEIRWPALPTGVTTDQRARERTRQIDVYRSALERVRALPGVERASLSVGLPFGFSFSQELRVPGWDSLPTVAGGSAGINAVTSDYLETIGARLVRGRGFTPEDHATSEPVAMVNETMAKTLWPGRDPIGGCLYTGDGEPRCARIVGVVGDARRARLREEPTMQYYIPYGQERGFGGTVLLVRPIGSLASIVPAVRRAIHEVDPSAAFVDVGSLQQRIDPQIRPWRLGAAVFGLMGVLALIVATAGLYSTLSYLVAQRTHEMGVRVALGATGGAIVRLVMRSSLVMATAGIAAGLAMAMAASRFVAPLLFETSPRDPLVLGAVAGLLLSVAVAASALPALRARRVNPMEALHVE